MAPRLWLAVFVVLQAADGAITYSAVRTFGLQAEGNPLLVAVMSAAGLGPAILGAKVLAVVCGAFLYVYRVYQVLAALTALYLFGAVMPWLHVLSVA
jgi:hypothetical protein